MRNRQIWLANSLVALGLVGCAYGGADNSQDAPLEIPGARDQAEEFSDLTQFEVASVEVGEDVQIGWYEPAPGVLLVVGKAKAGTDAQKYMNNGLDAVEYFKRLAPDQDVPVTLLAAHDRSREMLKQAEELGLEPLEVESELVPAPEAEGHGEPQNARDGDDIRAVSQAVEDDSLCPASWFQNTICKLCPEETCGSQTFHPYLHANDEVVKSDKWLIRAAGCSYRSNSALRVWIRSSSTWELKHQVMITQNWAAWYDYRAAFTIFGVDEVDVKSRVEPNTAAGAGVHHCLVAD